MLGKKPDTNRSKSPTGLGTAKNKLKTAVSKVKVGNGNKAVNCCCLLIHYIVVVKVQEFYFPFCVISFNLSLIMEDRYSREEAHFTFDDEQSLLNYYLSLVVRKPVFGVSDQVPHKPGCTVTEGG